MNTNKANDSVMTSLKHLQNLSPTGPRQAEVESALRKMANTPGLEPRSDAMKGYSCGRDFYHHNASASARWNAEKGGYELTSSFNTPIVQHPNRTFLWEALFGAPQWHVWNRFVRPFYYLAPEFVKLGRRLNTIKSYLAFDWLTNVVVPRINQYDPINYIEYCEKHLGHDPIEKPKWRDVVNTFGMDPRWWAPCSLPDPFKGNPYAIDDRCRLRLAQMFPVKPVMNKRII